MYTEDMKFVDTHEWIKTTSDNIATVGITNHAQELLGDLVYIELPNVGDIITLGATVGVVESVKAASDLYSPLSGEVIEINNEIINDPTLANSDPHNAGWLFKLKLTAPDELNSLLSVDKYKSLIG